MKKNIALVLFISLLTIFNLKAQFMGGGNNQSSPKEVGASSITAGGVSGDVNLFTGTVSSSYNLGTVSTATGLSFTATLNYSSTFSVGSDPSFTSGIPYGEGWSLDIPTISVDVEDYHKYTLWQKINPSLSTEDCSGGYVAFQDRECFSDDEAENEGKLFWSGPMVNIPGVASGRMIYKSHDGTKALFVLHKFERYIEATFDGRSWEVIVDDGTRYDFQPYQVSYRTPSNQRVPHNNPFVGTSLDYPAFNNLVAPKKEYLVWHCSSIKNSDQLGQINFTYDLYGALDFFKIYKQPKFSQSSLSNTYELFMPYMGDKAYRDVFVKEITSGFEKLVFNYSNIGLEGSKKIFLILMLQV